MFWGFKDAFRAFEEAFKSFEGAFKPLEFGAIEPLRVHRMSMLQAPLWANRGVEDE